MPRIVSASYNSIVPVNGTHSHTDDTDEQVLVELILSRVTKIDNFWFDVADLTQLFTVKIYNKVDGVNYREVPSMRLTNADPAVQGAGFCLKEMVVNTDWKITIQSLVAEGSVKSVEYRYFKEEFV